MALLLRYCKPKIYTLLLFCLSIIFSLLLCESALRLFPPSILSDTFKGYYIWPPNFKKTFRPNPDIMPGISGKSEFVVNSMGLRGDEIRKLNSFRILAIGGSTTECLYLDHTEAWPYLLQVYLNNHFMNSVWVGNAGMSGKNSRHHILAMQYLPLEKWNIDIVVIMLGINDFHLRLGQDDQYDPHYMDKSNAHDQLLFETFRGSNIYIKDEIFYKKTYIYALARVVKHIIVSKFNIEQEDETGEIFMKWREQRRQAVRIKNDLPPLSSSIEEYSKNINKIIDIAQEKNVRLLFATQPTMYKSGLSDDMKKLLWGGGIGKGNSKHIYYSIEALEKGIKAYNEELFRICSERNIGYIDLANMLNKDTSVFYDDDHFNENGARILAKILSNYIIKQHDIEHQKNLWISNIFDFTGVPTLYSDQDLTR